MSPSVNQSTSFKCLKTSSQPGGRLIGDTPYTIVNKLSRVKSYPSLLTVYKHI